MPCVHELARRIHLEEFTLQLVGVASADAGGSPTAAGAHIACELSRIEDAGAHPPLADLFGDQGLKNALGRRRDLYAGQYQTFGEVGNRTSATVPDVVHQRTRVNSNGTVIDLPPSLLLHAAVK